MPSVRGKKRKLQESIRCTRAHNLRSHEENKIGDDITTIISIEEMLVDELKTASSNEENGPNEVSMKHKKCKNICQEQSLEPNIDNVEVIHHSLSTNEVDNKVISTASKNEVTNTVEVRCNGFNGSAENVTSVSEVEADCLNDNNTVMDNNNSIVPVIENGCSSGVLSGNDCQTYKSAIGFYRNKESAEPTCKNMPIVLPNNNGDQVKLLDKETSAHSGVMEVYDIGIVNEVKCLEPTSKKSALNHYNGEKLHLNTDIPEQVQGNNNLNSVKCTINIIQNIIQEQENSKAVVETTDKTDLDVKLQQPNGSLNACSANDNVMNDKTTKGVENKTLALCHGETSIGSVTNKAVASSNPLPELLVQTEIAENSSLLAECGQEDNISSLTRLTEATSDCFENNEAGTAVPDGECKPCSTRDVIMRTDVKSALGEFRDQGMSGNNLQTSTKQMSGSLQLNCEYTKATDTADIACNKDLQGLSCNINKTSHAGKFFNKTVLYIVSKADESSSKDSKTTGTLGSSLTNATPLEVSNLNQNSIVRHNEGQTLASVEHCPSEIFDRIREHNSIENSAAGPSNINTEDINSSDSNRKDQATFNNLCNSNRLRDQICDISTPEWSKHPTQTETIESCGDKSSDLLLNSQQSTQNFLETYEVEKAETSEMEIAEFERTFTSAHWWTREVVEKKKIEGIELVKEILTQMCDMNQEMMAMKRQLDIVNREMTNNQTKQSTSKFFSKTNSNFSFFK